MEDLKQLFGKLVDQEVKDGVGSAETMKAIWPIIKNRPDPFSIAIKNVIIKKLTDVRRVASNVLRVHQDLFSGADSPETTDDQIIDFLAAQEKQVKIAEEILRDDLNPSTESH